jgi:small subunit ribosomal protein S6
VTHYELIWIGAPTLPPEEVERISQALEAGVKELGGTLLKAERWGKKRLAYKIRKHEEGYYLYYLMEAGHAVVDEIIRRLRMNDQILKFLAVRVDLEALTRAASRRPPREEREVAPTYPGEEEASQGMY